MCTMVSLYLVRLVVVVIVLVVVVVVVVVVVLGAVSYTHLTLPTSSEV